MVDLPGTMVDIPDTMVYLPDTLVDDMVFPTLRQVGYLDTETGD